MMLRWLAGAVATTLALASCASIPTDGPIEQGDLIVLPAEPFFPFAEGPRPDADAGGIVRGFLAASVTGVASDFTVAREFLTGEAGREWDPNAQVVVFDSGALTPSVDEDRGRVSYEVPVALVLDESGRMTEAETDARTRLDFSVSRDELDRWRISGLADGVLIAEPNFNRFYRPVELVFASADGTTMVTELRWFANNNIATHAARELIEGPSPWLKDAVTTGFPDGAGLEVQSVVVTDGVAAVQLTAESAGTPAERALAHEQLRLTLTALPEVTEVAVTVGGLPIGGDGSASLARPPTPGPVAAAMLGDRLGVWEEDEPLMVPDEVGRLPANSSGLAQSFDGGRAAFLIGGSQLVTTDALSVGAESLVPFNPEAEAPAHVMEVDLLLTGRSLTQPSFDRHGWIWIMESEGDQGATVIAPDGTVVQFEMRSLSGRTIEGAAVSRDGARIAVLSRVGGQQRVDVMGIVRGEDGGPRSLGEAYGFGVDIGLAADVAWVDDTTIAVMGAPTSDAPRVVWLVEVGGRSEILADVPEAALSLTARHGEQSLTFVAEDGDVRKRSGTGWTTVATGIRELAYAG